MSKAQQVVMDLCTFPVPTMTQAQKDLFTGILAEFGVDFDGVASAGCDISIQRGRDKEKGTFTRTLLITQGDVKT